VGCSSSDEGSGAADGGGGGVPGDDASIAFEAQGTLALAPGESAEITVLGTPAAPYAISFLLVGDSLDASIDQSNVVAGSDGRATVKLRAPNSATNFAVRAKIKDGPSVDLPVAVSDKGFGALLVDPVYNGQRDVGEWSAFVVSGKSCEALGETFPEDPAGALIANADASDELIIDVAPVGPTLAVFVRSKHYLWGCSDVTDLVAEETTEVEVFVKDRPIDVSDAQLDMTLSFEPDEAEWASVLAASETELLDGFTNGGEFAPALLAAMSLASPDALAFDTASTNGDWLTTINQHLSMNAIDLTTPIQGWAVAGLSVQSPQIAGQLTAIPEEPGYAVFTLDNLGSATPEALGIPSEYVMTITVDPDDTARVGGSLYWLPSRFVANAAAVQALASEPQGATMADVLGAMAMCDQLALSGLSGCDQTCISQLCSTALGTMWDAAADASASNATYGAIPMEASGASSFDEFANLTGFDGMWLGNILAGELSAKVSGLVTAQTPIPE
jgi:hypothetical protein